MAPHLNAGVSFSYTITALAKTTLCNFYHTFQNNTSFAHLLSKGCPFLFNLYLSSFLLKSIIFIFQVHTNQFKFLGILMGIAVRTGSPLSLNLAEPMWKLIAGASLTIKDISEVDKDYIPGLFCIRDMQPDPKVGALVKRQSIPTLRPAVKTSHLAQSCSFS